MTLGVVVESIRRFVAKLSASSSLSEEKTSTVELLLSNMTRAVELDAECEAHLASATTTDGDPIDIWLDAQDEVTSP